ncbi:MAG: Acetophenone carboxylase gamma subunit [Alphaproteobacteria bacterium MarineAlpha4_Bin2]|nr:MAG: Acetophenone carboxylase gamma subunit [Alphaproteobacteria bacterium MarineAlpha4_Bin2]
MPWRIGVDIGGTFTDAALVNEKTGEIGIAKTLTTPGDFGTGVVTALMEAIERYDVPADDVSLLSHATTVVTNAILEEKGARTALISTRGFRDILELRRSSRGNLYDMFQDPPSVLVPRHRRLEITERIDAQGNAIIPIDLSEIDALVIEIQRLNVDAVAVSLLFSFLNDTHEKMLGERLRAALPDTPVFLSSEVLPEIREFERTSTTAICAYVGPILASYLKRLEQAVSSLDLPALHVMGSAGGVVDVTEALRMPAAVVESGPAAGVIAAALVGEQIDRGNLLSFDMGGTTAKASLIRNGSIETTAEYEVGGGEGSQSRWLHGTGHPIRVPVIDLAEVSAGGGSIAWIDPAGALRVGPRSAGAEPGPVCYGRGGADPTVTDANLVLGYLDAGSLLGGRMSIEFDAAVKAFEAKVANPLGKSVEETAAGVIAIVNSNMADALRIVSVERGHDPREFSLIAFGGAGPLHAVALAEELDVPEVVIPPIPGGFSALGLVGTDIRRDYAKTHFAPLTETAPEAIDELWNEMIDDARGMLANTGVSENSWSFRRSADLRYSRQAYELNVMHNGERVTRSSLNELADGFHSRHAQTYGHKNEQEAIQIVTLRLTATGQLPALPIAQKTADGRNTLKTNRMAWFPGQGRVETPVLDRDRLAAGSQIRGPAILESLDSTIVVAPGWRARVDAKGFIRMTRGEEMELAR